MLWEHRVIILNRGSTCPAREGEESDAILPDHSVQRHSLMSFETARSLANGPSWGVGGGCWGRSMYSAFPGNCSDSYISFIYRNCLWAERTLWWDFIFTPLQYFSKSTNFIWMNCGPLQGLSPPPGCHPEHVPRTQCWPCTKCSRFSFVYGDLRVCYSRLIPPFRSSMLVSPGSSSCDDSPNSSISASLPLAPWGLGS